LSVHCSVGVCLGISPANLLYFNSLIPAFSLSYPSPLPGIAQQLSVCFCLVPTDAMYFSIILHHSLLLKCFLECIFLHTLPHSQQFS
jgi:hypothetical protein